MLGFRPQAPCNQPFLGSGSLPLCLNPLFFWPISLSLGQMEPLYFPLAPSTTTNCYSSPAPLGHVLSPYDWVLLPYQALLYSLAGLWASWLSTSCHPSPDYGLNHSCSQAYLFHCLACSWVLALFPFHLEVKLQSSVIYM